MRIYARYSLPASKCPGNSNSSSRQRCKVLKFVLIYGSMRHVWIRTDNLYSKKGQNKHKSSCLRFLIRYAPFCAFPGFLQRCLSRILDVSSLLCTAITTAIPPSASLCISDLFSIKSHKTKYTSKFPAGPQDNPQKTTWCVTRGVLRDSWYHRERRAEPAQKTCHYWPQEASTKLTHTPHNQYLYVSYTGNRSYFQITIRFHSFNLRKKDQTN